MMLFQLSKGMRVGIRPIIGGPVVWCRRPIEHGFICSPVGNPRHARLRTRGERPSPDSRRSVESADKIPIVIIRERDASSKLRIIEIPPHMGKDTGVRGCLVSPVIRIRNMLGFTGGWVGCRRV